MTADRSELGAFLRARRDRLSPAQAGIDAFPGARRVPGLRKEELAMLAGLSADYYSRLEQGRQANLSQSVLDALARALRLTDSERAHLRALAGPPAPDRRTRVEAAQRPDPGLLRLMDALNHLPVLLLGHRGEVLARNVLLTAVLGNSLDPGSSLIEYLFLDPVARARIVNWSDFAQACVAALRGETGRRPHDARLRALITGLRQSDADVERWWNDHAVRDYASVAKRIRHPDAGDLSFDIEIACAPHDPDQRLVVYTVQPNSSTARLLPLLASWAGDASRRSPSNGASDDDRYRPGGDRFPQGHTGSWRLGKPPLLCSS